MLEPGGYGPKTRLSLSWQQKIRKDFSVKLSNHHMRSLNSSKNFFKWWEKVNYIQMELKELKK